MLWLIFNCIYNLLLLLVIAPITLLILPYTEQHHTVCAVTHKWAHSHHLPHTLRKQRHSNGVQSMPENSHSLHMNVTFTHVHRCGLSCTPVLILHQNKIALCLFIGDIQTNEHTVHVWSSAIKHKGLTSCAWKHQGAHARARTHTEVHRSRGSLHLFKQRKNKWSRWHLTLHMSKIRRKVVESWHLFFVFDSEIVTSDKDLEANKMHQNKTALLDQRYYIHLP